MVNGKAIDQERCASAAWATESKLGFSAGVAKTSNSTTPSHTHHQHQVAPTSPRLALVSAPLDIPTTQRAAQAFPIATIPPTQGMASGFGLLGRLPGELRDRIYEHVATDTVIWIERNVRRPRDWIRGSEALLRTSRRIRAEFFPILKRQAVYAADIIHNVSFNRGYRTPDPPIELLWNVRALALSIRFCDGKHFHSANMGDVLGASNSLRAWRAVRDAMPDMLTRTRRLTLVLKGYIGWPGYEKENQYTRATLECLPRLQYYDVEIFGERYCAYRCPEEGVWKDEEPSTVYNWQDERESLNVFWDRK